VAIDALLPEYLFVIRFEEITPVIFVYKGFKNKQSGKISCCERHS
jgi:hypothetical protein